VAPAFLHFVDIRKIAGETPALRKAITRSEFRSPRSVMGNIG